MIASSSSSSSSSPSSSFSASSLSSLAWFSSLFLLHRAYSRGARVVSGDPLSMIEEGDLKGLRRLVEEQSWDINSVSAVGYAILVPFFFFFFLVDSLLLPLLLLLLLLLLSISLLPPCITPLLPFHMVVFVLSLICLPLSC